jgi:16S rRNA C967 or C1407 C5-methylase (RsmB/RsmF family)
VRKNFCDHHILEFFNKALSATSPLDSCLNTYFRGHKSLGANDRKTIALAIYSMVRWQILLDFILIKNKRNVNWENRLELFKYSSFYDYINDYSIPLHVRVSFPELYFNLLVKQYGEDKAKEICLISNTQAPTTVRVNTLKISREKLFAIWEKKYEIKLSYTSPTGIIFSKRVNLFGMEEFKKGFFEVQDEASQLIAALVNPFYKQQVLDFCAGSGGKTLAFAPSMQNQGQIYLYDNRPFMLMQAKKRLKRAGIQNAQIINDIKKFKHKVDWLLLDVPCSGSGTLRRNPDSKYRFSLSFLEELLQKQRDIFHEALSFVKEKGKIVYATCSILREENEEQIAYFMEKYNLKLVDKPFCTLPIENGMDGFFGAVLTKK